MPVSLWRTTHSCKYLLFTVESLSQQAPGQGLAGTILVWQVISCPVEHEMTSVFRVLATFCLPSEVLLCQQY